MGKNKVGLVHLLLQCRRYSKSFIPQKFHKNNKRTNERPERKDDWDIDGRAPLAMKNDNMFAYYKAQKLFEENTETEWDSFINAFRQPLPVTFRVTGNRSCVHLLCSTSSIDTFLLLSFPDPRRTARTLNETIVNKHVPNLQNVVFEDKPIPPPEQIPWCVACSS